MTSLFGHFQYFSIHFRQYTHEGIFFFFSFDFSPSTHCMNFSLGFPNYPSTAETLEKRKMKIDIFQKMPLCCKGGRGNDFLFARSFLYFIVTLCAVFVKITSWNQALIAVSLIRGENENKNWHFCDRMNGHAQRTLSLYTDSSSQTHKIFN